MYVLYTCVYPCLTAHPNSHRNQNPSELLPPPCLLTTITRNLAELQLASLKMEIRDVCCGIQADFSCTNQFPSWLSCEHAGLI